LRKKANWFAQVTQLWKGQRWQQGPQDPSTRILLNFVSVPHLCFFVFPPFRLIVSTWQESMIWAAHMYILMTKEERELSLANFSGKHPREGLLLAALGPIPIPRDERPYCWHIWATCSSCYQKDKIYPTRKEWITKTRVPGNCEFVDPNLCFPYFLVMNKCGRWYSEAGYKGAIKNKFRGRKLMFVKHSHVLCNILCATCVVHLTFTAVP
jgi:hypothetical protein